MKKKLLLATLAVFMSGAVVLQTKANANLVAKDKHLKSCQIYDSSGAVASFGNTCDSGSSNCTSNPC